MGIPDLSLLRPSPRRELQGPRPTPLRVRNDSHKVRKQPAAALPAPQPAQRQRPVIIYTLSPKVIHASPGEFMSLVQRLTGASSSALSSADAAPAPPAPALPEKTSQLASDGECRKSDHDVLGQRGMGGSETSRRTGFFPGVSSPVSSSLPLVSPNHFSSSTVQNQLSFFSELGPAFHGKMSFVESNTFLPSPNNFLPTPGAYWDLFNQRQEF